MSQTPPQISSLRIQLCTPRLFSMCWNAKPAISAQGPQQAAATERCLPHRRGFLGKTGDKGMEAPFGESQCQATAQVSRTGIGFRALSSVSSPTRDTRVSCSHSNATAKAVSLFHSLGLFQLFCNPILFRRGLGLFFFLTACKLFYSTSLWHDPFPTWITIGRGEKKREVRYHNSI